MRTVTQESVVQYKRSLAEDVDQNWKRELTVTFL